MNRCGWVRDFETLEKIMKTLVIPNLFWNIENHNRSGIETVLIFSASEPQET